MANQSMRYLNMRWNIPYKLTHLIAYGRTGQGKSQTIKNFVERTFLRGNTKIIDLYSGGAEEGSYYALESNHPFWAEREYTHDKKTIKKMEFPTNCIIPISKNIPRDLPDIYTPFTIPISSMTENDLKSILGSDLTKSEIALWRRVEEKINKETTLPDLMNMTIDAKGTGKKDERIPGVSAHGVSSIYNMFNGFDKHKLFSKKSSPLALNLLGELKNKKVITSLILKYFPEEYWGFIVNYFIHSIYDLVLQGKVKHNIVIVIREAGDFLEAMTNSPQEDAVKQNMINVLRKGRKHRLFFWIDNQTPMNMDVIKTQFPIKICHFVDNTEELKNALGDLGSMLLVKEDYLNMMSFKPGKCYILTNSGLFSPQILPPLSRMSGEEGADFFTLWRNEKGSRFKNITNDLIAINTEYSDAEKKWKNILLERKSKVKQKKEIEKIEKEQIKEDIREQRDKEKILKKIQMQKESIYSQKAIKNVPIKPDEEIDISECLRPDEFF